MRAFSSGLFVFFIATSAAQAWDKTEYNALMEHTGDTALEGSAHAVACRNAAVDFRIQWLEDDLALARVAMDSVREQYVRDRSAEETASGQYENGKSEGQKEDLGRIEQEIRQLGNAMDAIEERKQKDLAELDALKSKPPCTEPPEGPPPPPPPSPPPFPAPGLGQVSPRVPTHRTTSCAPCQGLANKLNAIIDELSAAQSENQAAGVVAKLQSDVANYSRALDVCERKCAVGPTYQPLEQGPKPSPPEHPRPKKVKHAKKHRVTEDSPAYMENAKPPAGTTSNPSQGSDEGNSPPPSHDENPSAPRAPDVPGPNAIPDHGAPN